MQHTFGVFRWRADGIYKPQDAIKLYKREYEAITYQEKVKPYKVEVRRIGLLGR